MLLTDKSIHVLSTIPPPDSLNGEKIKELRQLLIQNEIIEEKSEGLPDKQLVRYLIARNYDVKKSYDLFMVAFNWRQLRKPDELEMIDGWGNRMGRESETGKCLYTCFCIYIYEYIYVHLHIYVFMYSCISIDNSP
jgi:hypothetical protein